MLGRMHLGEIHRFGMARLVTPGTEHRSIEFHGHDGSGILRMFGLGTVAGFACHSRVAPGLLHLPDVVVTARAHLVACIGNRLGRDLSQSCSTVVPKFSKSLRHQQTARDKEQSHTNRECCRKANQMRRIFEGNHGSAEDTGWLLFRSSCFTLASQTRRGKVEICLG